MLQEKVNFIYLLILLINSVIRFLEYILEDLGLAIDILNDDAEPARPLSLRRVLWEEIDPLIFRGLVLVFFKVGYNIAAEVIIRTKFIFVIDLHLELLPAVFDVEVVHLVPHGVQILLYAPGREILATECQDNVGVRLARVVHGHQVPRLNHAYLKDGVFVEAVLVSLLPLLMQAVLLREILSLCLYALFFQLEIRYLVFRETLLSVVGKDKLVDEHQAVAIFVHQAEDVLCYGRVDLALR